MPIEILIKSFLRPECVMRLVNSIRQFYPHIVIRICDDGYLEYCPSAIIYKLPFYSGLAVGKNYLISLCETPYLLHFSGDSYMQKSNIDWVSKAIEILDNDKKIFVANPAWKKAFHEAKAESFDETEDFYIGFGFSDQCYLIRTSDFKKDIYGEKHDASERYPKYGGELFEKRIDSYLRTNEVYRITSKEVSYIHKNFPKKGFKKFIYNTFASYFAKKRLKKH